MMNAVYVVVITPVVLTVQAFQTVIALKITAALVTVTLQMIAYRIVLVIGVVA